MISEELRQQLLEKIRRSSPEQLDRWLDRYYDAMNRATEWDAEQWGFPQNWMRDERLKLMYNTPTRKTALS